MHRTFTFKIILRLTFIIINVVALSLILGDKRLLFNQIILAIVFIIQVYELIRFVNHTNRELSKFLLAIKYSDFSISFGGNKMGKSFKQLDNAFSEVIQSYKNAKIENEAQFQYLKLVVSRMNIGIVSLENGENIILMNEPAEKILGIQGIRNWKILKEKQPQFVSSIEAMGDHGNRLLEINLNGESTTLSLDVKSSISLDKEYKLITFKDIHGEIEQKEIEAWHKLIRILTHEIMNSITPISSLTETMQSMLNREEKPDDEMLSDLRFSLKTIQKRSDGMLAFVDDYRKLTKVAQPVLQPVPIHDLFESINRLMDHQINQEQTKLNIKIENDLAIDLDQALIEQVLINLITNSIHALREQDSDRVIELNGYSQEGKSIIEITDNGTGIGEKELKEVFVPFFSTKKEGSGIGLSLSKQIMHLHGGNIKVKSLEGSGTSFYLSFRV